MAVTLALKRTRGRFATENTFKSDRMFGYYVYLLAIASGDGFAPTLDVLANLTLDLYCSLISVTQLLPRSTVPTPIKTSKSLNEDEVYTYSLV